MNEITERITADLKRAMKGGEKLRVSTLRLLASELKNRRIELGRDLEEDEVIAVVSRARKQRAEAEGQYREGGREDLADKEAAEARILDEYLPEPVSEEELDRMIDAAVAEAGATGPQQMGAVMGRLMPQLRGRVDGAVVSRKVKERLG